MFCELINMGCRIFRYSIHWKRPCTSVEVLLTEKTGATATEVGKLVSLVFGIAMSECSLELEPVFRLRRLFTFLLFFCTLSAGMCTHYLLKLVQQLF